MDGLGHAGTGYRAQREGRDEENQEPQRRGGSVRSAVPVPARAFEGGEVRLTFSCPLSLPFSFAAAWASSNFEGGMAGSLLLALLLRRC